MNTHKNGGLCDVTQYSFGPLDHAPRSKDTRLAAPVLPLTTTHGKGISGFPTPGPQLSPPFSGKTSLRLPAALTPLLPTPAAAHRVAVRARSAPTGILQLRRPWDSTSTATATWPAPANSDTPRATPASRTAPGTAPHAQRRGTERSVPTATVRLPKLLQSKEGERRATRSRAYPDGIHIAALAPAAPEAQSQNPQVQTGLTKSAVSAVENTLW